MESSIGSPLKKHRPSINAGDGQGVLGSGSNTGLGDILSRNSAQAAPQAPAANAEEEEL